MSKNTQYLSGSIKEINKETRKATFILSDGDIDRHGDSLNPEGWKLENFKKNPVVLFGHNYRDLPVGKAVKVWLEKGKQLMGEVEFATHQFAEDVFQLVIGGFLNATSVGFIPLKLSEKGKYTWDEMELLEFSIVPIPANPRALGKKEIALFKSIEEKTGEPILKDEGDDVENDEENEPEVKTITLNETELKALVEGAAANAVKSYMEQQDQKQAEEAAQRNAKLMGDVVAMRDALKSGDKAIGRLLKQVKDIVDSKN